MGTAAGMCAGSPPSCARSLRWQQGRWRWSSEPSGCGRRGPRRLHSPRLPPRQLRSRWKFRRSSLGVSRPSDQRLHPQSRRDPQRLPTRRPNRRPQRRPQRLPTQCPNRYPQQRQGRSVQPAVSRPGRPRSCRPSRRQRDSEAEAALRAARLPSSARFALRSYLQPFAPELVRRTHPPAERWHARATRALDRRDDWRPRSARPGRSAHHRRGSAGATELCAGRVLGRMVDVPHGSSRRSSPRSAARRSARNCTCVDRDLPHQRPSASCSGPRRSSPSRT